MAIRLASEQDAINYVKWSYDTRDNGFNSEFATYPNLRTFVIEQDGEPLLYLPTHPVLAVESVAVNPNITAKLFITALLEAKALTEQIARQYGFAEIHTSSTYRPMLKTLTRHGYGAIPGIALRKTIN